MTPATLRAWRNLSISFGLVSIAVGISPMHDTGGVQSTQLCPDHKCGVKRSWYCETGDHYVPENALLKAYPAGDAQVVMTKDDLDGLVLDKSGKLVLTTAVPAADIDPAHFKSAYNIWPTKGAEEAYDLLVATLRSTGQALVGEGVLMKSTESMVLRWSESLGTLVAHVCNYGALVRWSTISVIRSEAETRPEPKPEMLALVGSIFSNLSAEYDPDAITDTYTERLTVAIGAKAAGGTIPKAAAPGKAGGTSLMEALLASAPAPVINLPAPDAAKLPVPAKARKAKVAA